MIDRPVAGVILAAGASGRLGGGPKCLLPYGRHTILHAVLDLAVDAGLSPLVLVLGKEADAVRTALSSHAAPPVLTVVNPAPESGIGGSVIAGVKQLLDRDVEAAAVLLADEPELEVHVIERVVRDWRRAGADVTRAVYTDRPGHPVILARSTFARLASTPGTARIIPELARAGFEIRLVRLSSTGPADVDTPDGYESAIRRSRRARECAGTPPTSAGPRGSPRR